jgi:hypothetical protein
MPCTITDKVGYRSSAGALVGLASLQVYAIPSSTAQTYSYSGTWRPNVGLNPNIVGNPGLSHGEVAVTNSVGEFTLVLPDASAETHPASPEAQWTLLFPDGQMLTGVVPAAAGPFGVDDLVQTYGWRWSSSIYAAPVTPGSVARGVVSFSGSSNSATVLFVPAMAASDYLITLASSVDTNTDEPMTVSYKNVSTSGFDIIAKDAAYVGTVRWSATL